MHHVVLSGVGYYLPTRVVTNRDLEAVLDTTDDWIASHTGIRERRFVTDDVHMSDMATAAARQALLHADVDPADVDLVICASSTPDYLMPATAAMVAHRVGAVRAAAFDMEAACSGYAYALVVASQFIRSGMYRRVLVIGGDLLSRFLNWKDRATAILFGDGCGAAVLEQGSEPGIVAARLGADGSGAEHIVIPLGSRVPPVGDPSRHEVRMKGREVYRWAVGLVPRLVQETCADAGWTIADVDHLVLHQANLRILEAVAERLSVPMERLVLNIDRMANTSAGTIAVALAEAAGQGRFAPGDKLLLAGFGSGLTWAGVGLRWTITRPLPQHDPRWSEPAQP
ncbi:MAG: beta-ketoacyl-ACP synthase III [Candidatus Sericytochromatia bacterium]|nr:beta-ketoacyl-ACP synthase III [Candidatus Sericytochromatia bacterium]